MRGLRFFLGGISISPSLRRNQIPACAGMTKKSNHLIGNAAPGFGRRGGAAGVWYYRGQILARRCRDAF